MVYGLSWYLDIVAENWDVIILDDYKMVMPLTHKKKYGVSYVFLPPWSQQLGIFSNIELNQKTVMRFLKAIPRRYKLVEILFNYQNHFSSRHLSARNNFILNLNHSYQSLFEHYSKLRKRSIKKAQKLKLNINELENPKSLIDLFKANKGNELKRKESDYEILNQLIMKAIDQQRAEILCVTDSRMNILGGMVLLSNKNRITYLFSAVNNKGREVNAITYLLDHAISKYAGRDIILDFEGSMIKGIAAFFKSFCAEKEVYYKYSTRRLI